MLVLAGLALAGAGAAVSIASAISSANAEEKELEAQKKASAALFEAEQREKAAALEREISASKERTERDIAQAQSEFEIQKQNAIEQASDWEADANATNRQATKRETLLSTAYGSTMDQIASQDEQNMLQEQRAKQNQLQGQSSLAAAMGASGVRSDSSQAEILVQNEKAFEQNLAQSKKDASLSRSNSLMSAYSGLSENMMNLGEGRRNAAEALSDATQLRNDYSDTGRASSLFGSQISNARANASSAEALARANAAGNLNVATLQQRLQQDSLSRAKERAKFDWLSADPWTAGFSGASTGLSLGLTATGFYKNWGK